MAEQRSLKRSRRLQLACEPCRVAKLKCDRAVPVCEQCYKRSRESACKYTEKGLRYNASTNSTDSMKEKLSRLEMLVDSLKGRQSLNDPSPLPDTIKISPTWSAKGEVSVQLGKLKLEKSGGSQWIGPSTWESVMEDIADIKAYFQEEEIQQSPSLLTSKTTSPESVLTDENYLLIPCNLSYAALLESMPQRLEMDRFVAAWFNLMDPARVILHAPTFQRQYETFWLEPQAAEPTLLALVLAMCSLGAEISGQTLNDVAIQSRADLLRKLASRALALANPARPRPWLIECLILHIVGLLFNQHDATIHIWQLVGQLIQLCHLAGYHRDPSKNPNVSQFACEMRRRVWMVACELDVSVSSTLGMVSSINHGICDTLPPFNLAETDFSPENWSPPRQYEECTLVQTEICFSRLVCVLGKIATSSHAIIAPSRGEVNAMNQQLDWIRDYLPEKLKMKPLDQSFIDSPTDIIDRLRLEFAYQKALCILYRRFLEDNNSEHERQTCLLAAESIVRYCVTMLEVAQPGGQLAPFKILLLRHVHDFTFAAMLICSQINGPSPSDPAFQKSMPGNDILYLILQACRLWDTLSLRSSRAKKALSVLTMYLSKRPRPLANTSADDNAEIVPGLRCSANPVNNIHDVTIGNDLDSLEDCPERCDSNEPISFDPMYGAGCNFFGDVVTGWSWSTNEEDCIASVIEDDSDR